VGIFNAVGTQSKGGLASRPTFGDVLKTCIALADEEQVRQAIAGSGDLSAAPAEVFHADGALLEVRTFEM
jgi:hypothetical protein